MSELCSGYGAALYSLAAENKMEKSVLSELHEICRALSENPDYMKVLGMPLIPFEEKEKLIDEAFSGAHEYVLNFLKILVKEHLQENIEKAAEEYEEAYMKDSGMIRAEAVSAVPLFENELVFAGSCDELTASDCNVLSVFKENGGNFGKLSGVGIKFGRSLSVVFYQKEL